MLKGLMFMQVIKKKTTGATDVVFCFVSSTRKRMSVVVRTPEGKIKLYCKGAVSTINNDGPFSFKDRCVSA